MFPESSRVILTEEIMEFGLPEGAAGTVLTIHGNGEAYDVEFTNKESETLAILTVEPEKLRLDQPEAPEAPASPAANANTALGATTDTNTTPTAETDTESH